MAGRPSTRDARYSQVMEGLVRCVARYGLDGASLSQIAQETGLTRPLIRHHLGNRAALLSSLAEFVLTRFSAQTDAMVQALPRGKRARALLDLLFSERAASEPDMVLAFAALTARAPSDPALREGCRACMLRFEQAVAGILRADHPAATPEAVEAAAHGIAALYLNLTSLAPLEMPGAWRAKAKSLAHKLLTELENRR